MPVHIVALSAPEVLLRLADLGRRVEDAAARELLTHDEHPFLQGVGFGVLRQEVTPERRSNESRHVVAQLVPRLHVPLRGVGLERPFRHLRIGARGDVDPPRGFLEDPRVFEGRRLYEVGLRDRRKELLEPAVLMDTLVRAGPGAELLAVVGVHDESRALIGSCAKLLHRLADVAERDEVPEPHTSREDDHGQALIFGDKGLAELLRPEARLKEMLVIEDRVGNTCLREERRQVGLPDAFRQPRPEGPLSEYRVHPVGKRPNLSDPVAAWHADQDRLVVPAGKELDLTSSDEVGQVADDVGSVGFEPVQERTGEVKTGLYFRVPIERGDERRIRPLGHILEH